MDVNIPDDLYEAVAASASRIGVSPDEVVRQAILGYLMVERGVAAELGPWEAARLEALALADRLPEKGKAT